MSNPRQKSPSQSQELRARIIDATFQALMERGYAGTSTREIARRARVSKRELYALFDSKDGILAAMIESRAARMRAPLLAMPEASDRASLAQTLTRFGIGLLLEGSSPAVTAIFRLAMVEAEQTPALARQLDEVGRKPVRDALVALLDCAKHRGLIGGGDAPTMASWFCALLWRDLQIALLLRLVDPPSPEEIERRVGYAVSALLSLYPEPVARTG
ncbi:MAG: TetR/AcrR family transcriptional regulator [Stellaceae bacterium]